MTEREKAISQNLKDAGCGADIINQFLQLQKGECLKGFGSCRKKDVAFLMQFMRNRKSRPEKEVPDDFGEVVKAWEQKRLAFSEVLKKCGMSEATFYRRVREYRLIRDSKKG